jgi:hypothetical protein
MGSPSEARSEGREGTAKESNLARLRFSWRRFSGLRLSGELFSSLRCFLTCYVPLLLLFYEFRDWMLLMLDSLIADLQAPTLSSESAPYPPSLTWSRRQ